MYTSMLPWHTNRWGDRGCDQQKATRSGTSWCHGSRSGTQTAVLRQTATEGCVNATAASTAHTCLSMSRSAYLTVGSWRVIAGFFLENNSLKMRLTMLSKPPRISCNKSRYTVNSAGRCLWLHPQQGAMSHGGSCLFACRLTLASVSVN